MVTINKRWVIKQLFYGTTATQFTYNTNNQIKSTVLVYVNKKLNQACIAMQQQVKEYIYRKQNSLSPRAVTRKFVLI